MRGRPGDDFPSPARKTIIVDRREVRLTSATQTALGLVALSKAAPVPVSFSRPRTWPLAFDQNVRSWVCGRLSVRPTWPRQGQRRDRSAHRLRLYLALHEGADALDGRSRFRKDPRPDLPGVRHPRPYFEFDLTSGGAHPLRHAHGIIEEDLVAADLDERRRQS